MLGAILGDIAGSRYEFIDNRVVPQELWVPGDFFTDDTVLTCATAEALLVYGNCSLREKYLYTIRSAVEKYPDKSYGGGFIAWVRGIPPVGKMNLEDYVEKNKKKLDELKDRDSLGNGSAMKISPVVYFSENLTQARKFAKQLTSVTHNTAQGLKAADSLVVTMWLALNGATKSALKKVILQSYPRVKDMTYEELNKTYEYSELAEDTMPAAFVCFLESTDYVDAVKKAVSIGGDADTLAAITGALAEAFYKYNSRNKFEERYALADMYLTRDLFRKLSFLDSSKLIR